MIDDGSDPRAGISAGGMNGFADMILNGQAIGAGDSKRITTGDPVTNETVNISQYNIAAAIYISPNSKESLLKSTKITSITNELTGTSMYFAFEGFAEDIDEEEDDEEEEDKGDKEDKGGGGDFNLGLGYSAILSDTIKVVKTPTNPGDPMYIYLKKIRNSPQLLSINDIEALFVRFLNPEDLELISVIFSLEKTHFYALVFLLFIGTISPNDIRKMIEMTYYNREEALLALLQKDKDELFIFRNFISAMNLKFSNLEKRFPEKIQDLSATIKNTTATINDNIVDYTSSVIQTNLIIDPFLNISSKLSRNYRRLLNRLSYRTKDREQVKATLNKLLLETRNKVIDRKSFYTVVLGKYFPNIVKRYYGNRLYYSWRRLSSSFNLIEEAEVTSTVQSAIEDVYTGAQETRDTNYFKILYNIYNGTENQEPSTVSDMYNFNYITNTYIRGLMNSIFPDNTEFSISKSSSKYLARYFLTFESDVGTSSESSFFNVNSSFVKPLIEGLLENDILVDDDRNVLTLGSSSKVSFIIDSFIDSFNSIISNSTMTLLNLENIIGSAYSRVVTHNNQLKTNTKDIIAGLEYGSISEKIFKVFFLDIFEQYMDYLVNGKDEDFVMKLSTEAFKIYKLLSFVQQTFMNIITIIDKIENNEVYQTFSNSLVLFNSPDYAETFLNNLEGD
jgi:hypothetical protein